MLGRYRKYFRQAKGVEIVRQPGLRAGIGLVDGHGDRFAEPLENAREVPVGAGDLTSSVHQKNDVRGAFEGHVRLLEDLGGNVRRVVRDDAARVDHLEEPAVVFGGAVYAVARDAGLIAHNGAPLSGDAIEKCGFTNVGPSHDDHGGERLRHVNSMIAGRAGATLAAMYPIFLDLRGRSVLVAGGGRIALRKAARLVEAGARVTVVAPEVLPGIEALPVAIVRRRFRRADVRGAVLVFAATDDRAVNRRVGEAARQAGTLANIADARAECDFMVPAVAARGGIAVAISTGGENPRRAAALRRRLESFLEAADETGAGGRGNA